MRCWVDNSQGRLALLLRASTHGPARKDIIILLAVCLLLIGTAADADTGLAASAASPPAGAQRYTLAAGWQRFLEGTFAEDLPPPTPAPEDPPKNLLAPDLRTVPPTRLRLTDVAQSGRLLLRFDNTIYNSGSGALEVIGQLDGSADETMVHQRLYIRTGATAERRVGEFTFHPGHFHWHMKDFALYEVLPVSAFGGLTAAVASNNKVGYCLMDLRLERHVAGGSEPPRAQYIGCDKEIQGISAGWGDIYEYFRPDQWVDVTGLADGLYALRSTVDPDNLLLEEDETNNTAIVFFLLQDQTVQVLPGLRLPY